MKIWKFADPHDYTYARAIRRGTWEGTPSVRVKPLIIEWEPDSDLVGDFTWPGFNSDIVITQRVADAFARGRVEGYELSDVIMVDNASAKASRSKKRRVKLPYNGPPLWDFWITQWAELDLTRSTFKVTEDSGGKVYEVVGIPRRESSWDPKLGIINETWHPRVPGMGLFVKSVSGVFRIREFPSPIFCTDEVKQLVESNHFTNVTFREMGDIVA